MTKSGSEGARRESSTTAFPDDIVVRRAAADDLDAIVRVWIDSFAAALPTVTRAHDDAAVREWFRSVVLPHRETWVAVADGALVGILVLDGDELSQLYLSPAWRGRGIGDRLIALAKTLRPRRLTLHTFQVNTPARRFYERHGFVETGTSDGADNEEREPDVRYVWEESPAS